MSDRIETKHDLEVAYAKGREDGRTENAAIIGHLRMESDGHLDLYNRTKARLEADLAALLPLAQFGLAMFELHREHLCDISAEDANEDAEQFGLLVEERRTEPCGDECRCVEWGLEGAWNCDMPARCIGEARAIIRANSDHIVDVNKMVPSDKDADK